MRDGDGLTGIDHAHASLVMHSHQDVTINQRAHAVPRSIMEQMSCARSMQHDTAYPARTRPAEVEGFNGSCMT